MLTNQGADQQSGNWTNTPGQLDQLFAQAPVLMAVLRGESGILEYYNPEFGKVGTHNALFNQPVHSAVNQPAGKEIGDQVKRVYDTGQSTYLRELPITARWNPDETEKTGYFDITCSPLRNNEGAINGVMLLGMNVTQKAITQRELAEQQLLFENITNAAGTALWMINAQGQITFVNQAWINWTGRPLKAHLGRGWISSVAPEDRHWVIDTYMRQLGHRKPWHIDFRVLRADKELQWVAASGKPRYLADGSFAGYVGSCMDITERKNAEQAAKDSQERFRLIADSAPVLIWMTGKEQTITFLNRRFMDYLGLASLKDHPADPLNAHVHPDDRERLIEVYVRSFELQSEYYIEYRIKNADGNYRWIAMKGIPRYNENGAFKGYIGSGMDITEMKEHEQIKNDFIGMASHELKTPITSIKAYVQILLNRYSSAAEDDFTKKSLVTVNKQVSRLTRLVSDLLDVSKMDSGRLSLNLDTIILNDVVKEAIDEVQHTTSNHKINYHEDLCCKIVADRDRIAQVVTNLLTNAVKYSPLADAVEVSVSGNETDVMVAVRDYGIGINKDDQHKVFNRFYRVEGKNEQTFSGFGIGLFIAAEIIKRHKGRIEVQSEQGGGTTFLFRLPVATLEC